MNRPSSIVARYPDRHQAPVVIECQGLAKIGIAAQRHRHITHTGVTRADGAHLIAAAKCSIGKVEQSHRTRVCLGIGGAIIVRRAHCQMQPVSAKCQAGTKIVVGLQTDTNVFAAAVAQANGANQAGTAKIAVGKGHQMHCASIGHRGLHSTPYITRRTNRHLPGVRTQGHRRAQLLAAAVAIAGERHVQTGAAAVAVADGAKLDSASQPRRKAKELHCTGIPLPAIASVIRHAHSHAGAVRTQRQRLPKIGVRRHVQVQVVRADVAIA